MGSGGANGAVPAAPAEGEQAPVRLLWLGIAVLAIVVLDQLTKSWAVSRLSDGPISVIGDFAGFRLARNSGAAFGRFQGITPILAIGAIVVTVLLVRATRRETDRVLLVGLVIVLGGALGNLTDRIFRSPGVLRGWVVDFVAVGDFPRFNVADAAITIGAAILIVRSLQTSAEKSAP